MRFYTPEDAVEWLKSKVSDLFAARGNLQNAYGRAVLARSRLTDPVQVAKADQLIADLTTSIKDQNSLEHKVRYVVPDSWIPQQLGFIAALVVGAGAIAIAGAVALHLERVADHMHTLSLIEKGLLTPAQALALQPAGFSLFGGMGSSMLWLVLGGGIVGYFVLRR